MLTTRLNDYQGEQFEIDHNETPEEVLRRSKTDLYYLESVKVFEQAFAIKKLDNITDKIQRQRTAVEYAPDKGSYQFTPEDLTDQVSRIHKFKQRHDVINDRVSDTYLIGTKFQAYLSKRCILDFHFRGEQDLFEQEYPDLKDEALKLLGPVLYYDLSAMNGQTLPSTSEQYGQLMKLY